jgi:hypothetical protein
VNRHTAATGSQLYARGRNLQDTTRIELGGAECPILLRGRSSVYFQIPDGCAGGSLVITNPQGATSYATPIKVAQTNNPTDDDAKGDNAKGGDSAGPGLLQTLLKDDDVQRAVQHAAPSALKPFVAPFMDSLGSKIGGAGMSGRAAHLAKIGIAGAGGFLMGRAAGTSGFLSGAGSMAGMAMGGPMGAAGGAGIGTVIEKSVRSASEDGDRAARSFVAGASSVVNSAYQTGAKIGNTLLSAVAQPFGASGTAVTQFASKVADSVGGLLQSGLDKLSAGAGLAGRVAGGGVGLGLTGAGALMGASVGVLGGPGGMLAGAAVGGLVGSLAGALALKITSAVADAVGGALGVVGKTIGAVGDLGVSGLRTVLDVLRDLSDTAQKFGRDVAVIRAQSGLSNGQAGTFSLAFGSLGLGSHALGLTQNMANHPQLYGMKAGLFGVPGYENANFLPSLAGRFQGMQRTGIVGQMFARHMTQSLGMDSPEALRVLQIDAGKLRSQVTWSQNLQGSLGLDAGKIRDVSDSLFLTQNRFDTFASMLKLRIGQELLPYLSGVLDKGIAYVSAHAGDISNWIKKGVSWLVEDLPPLLMRGAAMGLRAVAGWSDVSAGFSDGLRAHLPQIARHFDNFLNFLRETVKTVGSLTNQAVKLANGFSTGKGLPPVLEYPKRLGETARNVTGQRDPNAAPGVGDTVTNIVTGLGTGLIGQRVLKWGAKRWFGGGKGSGGGTGSKGGGRGWNLNPRNWFGGGKPSVFQQYRPPGMGGGGNGSLLTRSWQSLRGLASVGRGLLSGGFGGIAGRGLAGGAAAVGGGGVGSLLAPTAIGVAGGTAVGYGLYRVGQGVGLIDREQGFGDRMSTGWGRLRDAVTFNSGHYDRTVNARWARENRARQEQEQQQAAEQAAATTTNPQSANPQSPNPLPPSVSGFNVSQYAQPDGPIAQQLDGASRALRSFSESMRSKADGFDKAANDYQGYTKNEGTKSDGTKKSEERGNGLLNEAEQAPEEFAARLRQATDKHRQGFKDSAGVPRTPVEERDAARVPKTPMEEVVALLRALVENTGNQGDKQIKVAVELQPHADFIGKILAIEAWEDYTMLSGRTAG